MIFKNFDYFLSIVETGNITRSAAKLHISQPSLTQHLHHLEDEVGAVLFDRNSFPLKLTPAGEVFYEYVLKCRELDDKLSFDIAVLRTDISGKLTIGVPVQLQPYFMKTVLVPFLDEYPDIEVNVRGESSHELEKLLQQRAVDLAMIYCLKPLVSTLRYVKLREDELRLICSSRSPLAEREEEISLPELEKETFFMVSSDSVIREAVDAVFASQGFRPAKTRVIPGVEAVMDLVAVGKGIAVVPDTFLDSYSRRNELKILKLRTPFPHLNHTLLTHKANCPRQVSCLAKYIEINGRR